MKNQKGFRPQERSSSAPRATADIREELIALYQKHNPSKLEDVDNILSKYAGKEEQLLKAVRDKYSTAAGAEAATTKPWFFVLKNYCSKHDYDGDKEKIKAANWNIKESIQEVRPVLDELAESIGGACTDSIPGKYGQKRLSVVQKKGWTMSDMAVVEDVVDKMRKVIQQRYEKKNYARNFSNEHDGKAHRQRKDTRRR